MNPEELLMERLRYIGSPVKLKILSLLGKMKIEMASHVIAEHIGESRGVTSTHLVELARSGLIDKLHSGRYTFYRIDSEAIKNVLWDLLDQLSLVPQTNEGKTDDNEARRTEDDSDSEDSSVGSAG